MPALRRSPAIWRFRRRILSTYWQGDQVPQAVGEYMNQKGVKTAYLIAPNYAAGKDVIAGVRRTSRAKLLGEDYTRWPDQLDFPPNCRRPAPPSRTPSLRSIPAPPACNS